MSGQQWSLSSGLTGCGSAHKAAYPDRFKVKDEARSMYPTYEGIEARYGPTKVHLQIWDGKGTIFFLHVRS